MRRLAAITMCIVGAGAAHAQTANRYPTRPVRIVVPFAAGGGVDYVARIVAQRLMEGDEADALRRHRASASGTIGVEYVAYRLILSVFLRVLRVFASML